MEAVYNFISGPILTASLTIMVLGLLRTMIIAILGMKSAISRAGDKNIPYKALINETLSWIFPIKHILTVRPFFSITSVLFHIGLILVPLFLLDHILLWQKIGLSWFSIPSAVAHPLTILTIISGIILLGNRLLHKNSRFISGGTDYFLLIALVSIFVTGFIASRPWNPISHQSTMVIHAFLGNVIILMFPFSKLSHCILFPLLRIASNIAWHFPARAGEKINKTLYGEEIRKI